MKKFILINLFVLLFICKLNNCVVKYNDVEKIETEWEVFIKALILTESNGNRLAIGKTNDVGILQITPVYVEEVNRILGENRFTLECRKDIRKSLEMFEIYQSYYNPDKDIEKAIKLHNPKAGLDYKNKILQKLFLLKNGKLTNI